MHSEGNSWTLFSDLCSPQLEEEPVSALFVSGLSAPELSRLNVFISGWKIVLLLLLSLDQVSGVVAPRYALWAL